MDEHHKHDEQITANILRDIDEHGVHIAFVDTDGYTPRFGYSIGLFKGYSHPELIIIGLSQESVGAIINKARSEMEKGIRYIEGVKYDGFLHGFPMQFVEVQLEHYQDYVGYAGWYNDNSFDFPVLQMVWPDKETCFPWDEGFNPNFKFQQPLLDRNVNFKFLEERKLGVYTTSEVLDGAHIRFVYHNEDGDWQFHSEQEPNLDQAKVVCLEDLVNRDPSLNEVYYLNYGESAERADIYSEWKVFSAD